MHPYPLVFEPILKEKVWGGRRLASLGKDLPLGVRVGESWELADLAATSADGGGGEAARSVIANGEMRGMALHDAVFAQGANLLGHLHMLPGDASNAGGAGGGGAGGGGGDLSAGGFPLLLKYLDARENLSVQVHPSPAYAAKHASAHLKTESWYVVEAEPNSVIYKGVKPGVTREAFAAHIEDGSVVDDLVAVPATPGDVHHLPSGTCHALGAGVLVAEVQTASDTTFRVFDWGRAGRTLHVAQALECIDFGPPPATVRPDAVPVDDDGGRTLVKTQRYVARRLSAEGDTERPVPTPEDLPVLWMVLRGSGKLEHPDKAFEPVRFETGTTLMLPARLDAVTAAFERDATILEIRFPPR